MRANPQVQTGTRAVERDAGTAPSTPADNPGPSRDHFFSAYPGKPPWDIGRAQENYLRLADAGAVRGSVLDVGCGTGENALLFSERSHEAWGIDMVPAAIELARAKAKERGLGAHFEVADALALGELGRTFETVIDSGLFHVFSDEDRLLFRQSLERVLQPGGTYFLLCFSDAEQGTCGPRRIRQEEIRATFGAPWRVVSIEATRFESTMHEGGARAWFAAIECAGRDEGAESSSP